jgi:ATP-dependent Clp protease protease subunit
MIKNYDDSPNGARYAVDRRTRERLLDARKILVFGEVNQQLAESVVAQLLSLDAHEVAPIHVLVNSQGGHVESADTIHDVIRFVRSPVVVIGTGWVASAGVHLYLAAERERRLCLPNTRYMIHEPSGGVGGQVSDIEIELEQMLELRRRIRQTIAERTGRSYQDVERDTQRNCWLTAVQAVEYGLVGKIVEHINDVSSALS